MDINLPMDKNQLLGLTWDVAAAKNVAHLL